MQAAQAGTHQSHGWALLLIIPDVARAIFFAALTLKGMNCACVFMQLDHVFLAPSKQNNISNF